MQEPISRYTAEQQQALMKLGESVLGLMAAFGHVPDSREMRLLSKYGERMKQTEAAAEVGIDPHTVGNMLRDGRLEKAGETGVSTLSVARYLDNEKDNNLKVRRSKQKRI